MRLTIAIRAVRVELATLVTLRDVQQRQVTHSSDLNIVGCLNEMGTRDRTIGNEARAVARLDAPGDLDALRVADDGTGPWGRGREQAEVVERVHCERMSGSQSRELVAA